LDGRNEYALHLAMHEESLKSNQRTRMPLNNLKRKPAKEVEAIRSEAERLRRWIREGKA